MPWANAMAARFFFGCSLPHAALPAGVVMVVAPKGAEWFGFVLGHVSSVDFVEHSNAGSTGTKMPRTSWHDMARYEVALPPPLIAAAYSARVQSLIDRIVGSIHESRTLAAIRDTLLPKLICGELRVPDAERIFARNTSWPMRTQA